MLIIREFLLPAPGLEVTLDKDHSQDPLLAHREQREVGITVSRAQPDFHSDTQRHPSLIDSQQEYHLHTATNTEPMLTTTKI